jgi:hypothetical protein
LPFFADLQYSAKKEITERIAGKRRTRITKAKMTSEQRIRNTTLKIKVAMKMVGTGSTRKSQNRHQQTTTKSHINCLSARVESSNVQENNENIATGFCDWI